MKRGKIVLVISIGLIALIVIGVFLVQQPHEKAATNFLSAFYTVADYEFVNSVKKTSGEEFINNASAPYKDLLTEKGLYQLTENAMLIKIDTIAQENNCKFYVDKINLIKRTKIDNDTFQYNFEVIINVNNNEKVIKQTGIIIVKKVNSIWKIDYLKIFNLQDIQRTVKQ